MAQRISRLIFLFLFTAFFACQTQAAFWNSSSNAQPKFVRVDQAFLLDFFQQNDRMELSWQIKPGYYLYKKQINIVADNAQIDEIALPQALAHNDKYYGDVEIYTGSLKIPLNLIQVGENARLTVTYQGCATAGFCYPPVTQEIALNSLIANADSDVDSATSSTLSSLDLSPTKPLSAIEPDAEPQAGNPLPFSPLWALLFGIAIAVTPCVLPMYPLISGIILSGNRQKSLKQTLLLSFVYVQGMALTYTLLGLIVAAVGLQFQAAFQHPALLVGLSVLFILLSLSMFGLYSLQLPSSLQTRLTEWSNKQSAGSLFGVFMMGALAGLICSPCTTAPLSAILLYIAQSGDIIAGAGTLYLYALGMGIPLMLIAVFGNRILPRSGPWMAYVKEGMGFIILALPVFLLERVIGSEWGLRLWSILGVAFFGWALMVSLHFKSGWSRFAQIICFSAALISVKPLQDWAFGSTQIPRDSIEQPHLVFKQISSVDDLNQALKEAKGKRVMLDLYADWCVSCIEFEKYTFRDAIVQSELKDMLLLQADVTKNEKQHAELMRTLQVLGLPTIIFFDEQGQELSTQRVTGFMNAKVFLQHLQRLQ